jgi:3-oxoacyl-[acyl-carrier-protein] synthase-3
MIQARIIAQSSYLPKRILTNHDLEKMVATTDEWIFSRTGIRQRHLAAENERTSDMGAHVARLALANANLQADEIDLILVATMTGDYQTPSTACLIQHTLKCEAAAFDLSAACSGYLYALATAKAYIESGMAKKVLVIAAEKLSSVINWQDRSTCVLFGDGAGACVVAAEGPGLAIGKMVLGSDGQQQELLKIPAGGSSYPSSHESVDKGAHFLTMDGRELFRHAVRRLVQAANEGLEKNQLTHDQIDWLVCHQANERILEAVAQKLNFDFKRVYKNLDRYGNTSAASVAIALDELCKDASVLPFKNLLLMAFGAGLTWASTTLKRIN